MAVVSELTAERTCFGVFFFSSRRRHTRCGRDWSSDVCSSDLSSSIRLAFYSVSESIRWKLHFDKLLPAVCRAYCIRSEERRVGKSVDLGGRRIINKKTDATIEHI